MLNKITVIENTLDKSSWLEFECENICEFLMERYKEFPKNARIYHKNICETSDVTPHYEKDVDNLLSLNGDFYFIIYPGDFTTIALIVSLVVLAVVVLTTQIPKIPAIASRNGDQASPNNELSERTNKARVNGRIPDIYGQVRSTPDLIALPYKIYENNKEKEYCYMAIGRGEYLIDEIRDENTLISQIDGSSVEVYAPMTSPNSGDSPILSIGTPINEPIKNVIRYSSVNGQVLVPQAKESGSFANLKFTHDKKIVNAFPLAGEKAFTELYSIGDTAIVEIAYEYQETSPGDYIIIGNYSGSYLVTNVTATEVTVSDVSANSDWTAHVTAVTDSTLLNGTLKTSSDGFTGPFIINKDDTKEIWVNFVALNGIYSDNGTTRIPFPVSIVLKLIPINSSEVEIGPAEEFTSVLLWDGSDNLSVGTTLKAVPTFTGRCKVSARRITAKTIISGSQVAEEIKWRDLFSVSPISETNFGNVTTVQSKTIANSGSLAIKERKLNCLVTRKIPQRISGSSFTSTLYATKNAAEIISTLCLDKYIGNRSVSEVDFDNIYNTVSAIQTYFGTLKAGEFCYTFDSSNFSFEETMHAVANSIFSIAYRRGNQIKLSFEKKNDTSTILFNHRNKIPGTETRTLIFGNANDKDGVEFKYIDAVDDSLISIYLPSDKSAVNPEIIESIGIRNYPQAYFSALRAYNKIRYNNQNIECEVTQEGSLCVINDRILISDGTRSGSFEGEILDQNILELTLSQNLNLLDGIDYTIFLQYSDGTVDSMGITKTSTANKILLEHLPSISLALTNELYARTTFVITSNNDHRKTAFILTEKTPKGIMTSEIKAINYDDRYYSNDKDLINGVIVDS